MNRAYYEKKSANYIRTIISAKKELRRKTKRDLVAYEERFGTGKSASENMKWKIANLSDEIELLELVWKKVYNREHYLRNK